jgi:hypothetical protein
MSRHDLKAVLRQQVEFYLSRENLAHDTYLRSLMDAQNTVPIDEIVRFRKMIQICDDPDLLKTLVPEAIAGSSVCSVTADGTGLRPMIKSERNTIILRDISSDTKPDRVREIFSMPGGKPVRSIRSDVGDTWFVTMESEADAVATMLAIRNQAITFQGAPIKARLKSEVGSFMGQAASPGGGMNRGAHGAQHAPPPHHMPHQGLGGVHGGFPIGTMPPPMGHQVAYMPPHMNAQGGYGAQYMPGAGYHRHPRMSTQQGHRQMPPYAYAPGMGMRPLAVTSVRLNGDVRQGNVRGVNVRTDSAQGKSFQKKGSHPNAHNPSGYTTVKSPGSEAATTTTTKKKKKKEKKEAALNGAEAAAPGGKPPNAGTSPSDAPKPVKDHKKQTVAETATDEPGEASPAQDATATPSSIPEKNDDQNRKFGASSSAGETSGSGVDNFPPLPGEKQADGQSPADTAPPAASAPIAAATQMASEGSQKNAAVVDDDIPLFFGSISFGSEGTTSSDNSAAVDKPAPAKPPPESSSGGDDEIPVTISFGAEGSIVAGESGVSTTAPDTQNSESSTVSSPQRRPVGYAAALLNGSSGSSSPSGNKPDGMRRSIPPAAATASPESTPSATTSPTSAPAASSAASEVRASHHPVCPIIFCEYLMLDVPFVQSLPPAAWAGKRSFVAVLKDPN